ncbi:MAG: hypothetical protein JSS66_10215 [Armatimonadetes bacterium]|nr:hypothetical protein [Armatimonadota bacterium]
MSKTTKIVIAVVAVFLLVCCGGGGLLVYGGFKGYKSASADIVGLGDGMVTAVCKDWDADELMKRGGAGIKQIPADELRGFLNVWKGEYGAYQSGKGAMTSLYTNSVNGRTTTTATYENEATFEKASGHIKLDLIKEGGEWKINRFNVTRR